ncbi:hypothetical protein WJX79_008471 [Trebouxia sp. C0005]
MLQGTTLPQQLETLAQTKRCRVQPSDKVVLKLSCHLLADSSTPYQEEPITDCLQHGKKDLVDAHTSKTKRSFADIQQKVLHDPVAGGMGHPLQRLMCHQIASGVHCVNWLGVRAQPRNTHRRAQSLGGAAAGHACFSNPSVRRYAGSSCRRFELWDPKPEPHSPRAGVTPAGANTKSLPFIDFEQCRLAR